MSDQRSAAMGIGCWPEAATAGRDLPQRARRDVEEEKLSADYEDSGKEIRSMRAKPFS
jgi:hypothetical protein